MASEIESALVDACRAVVEQLSPANVDVVIKPGCEPLSVKLCREALAAFEAEQDCRRSYSPGPPAFNMPKHGR